MKKLTILLLFSMLFWHFSTYAANVNKEISEARNYYLRHKYQKAINILENIRGKEISKEKKLRVNNLLSKAYIKYAYAELKNNRISLDDFISLNKKAYNFDPSQTEAVYRIAVSYGKTNQVEEGIKWMEKAYPKIVNKKNRKLLSAIKVDPDLIYLRSYPKFNEKFPELATHDVGGVQYSLIKCSSQSFRGVRVDVPKKVDLSRDSIAKSILKEAAHYAQKKCPKKEPFSNISVNICYPGERINMASVHARNYDNNKLNWQEYRNKPLRMRLGQENQEAVKAREKARKEKQRKELAARKAKEDQDKAARKAKEDQDKAEAKKRLKQFEKKYGVTDWPVMKEFHVNPFIYEGKKVAFVSEFGTMLSATEGIFKCGGEFEYFIVSDIPKGFFSKEAEVVITGRPLGKKETKLPLFGEVLVPNLKFVGAYFCEEQHCKDIVWK